MLPSLMQQSGAPSAQVNSGQSLNTIPSSIPNVLTPEQQAAQQNAKDERNKLFDYGAAQIQLKRLVSDWKEEISETEKRRKTRDVHVDVEDLRQRGDIDEDETLVPVRVIDTNIQRELPPYINYLKNSRRLCTFNSLDVPDQDTQLLELDYTRGMTYLSWETPHYKCLDGSATHGWDAVEVVYDESKPLHVGLEHIGHDMLFFPRTNRDVQQSPRLIRAYDLTTMQLKNFVTKFGFDAAQVETIVASRKDGSKEGETVRIYKQFFKYEGSVYVSWFAIEEASQVGDWLKAPVALTLGIASQAPTGQWVDKPITQYPVFLLPYRETEKPKLIDHKGRVFMDEAKQESQTAILSGFVNGITRASNIYASVGQEDGTGSSLKELNDVKLTGGRIFNHPINFFHTEYPDPMVLKSMQYFDVANSQETGQTNFAATNREDSRKTAREISSSEQQQSLLNSVQLTLFSTHIRAVYSFAWLIVQSQALQGKIAFLRISKQRPAMNPAMPGTPVIDPQTQQPVMETYFENNFDIIKQAYDIRAAGDVDVIQRTEKISQMMQDWPVISQTPLAGQFLQDLVRLKYPDQGQRYATVLGQQDNAANMQSLVARLGTMMQGAVAQHPEMMDALSPSDRATMQQTIQQAMQVSQQIQPAANGGQA